MFTIHANENTKGIRENWKLMNGSKVERFQEIKTMNQNGLRMFSNGHGSKKEENEKHKERENEQTRLRVK